MPVPILAAALLAVTTAPPPARPPAVVAFTAFDFAFQGPDSATAGEVVIRLDNKGTKLHHVQLVRLAPGHTTWELIQAWRPGRPMPAWAASVGGPTAALGGQAIESRQVLEPGRHAVLCWVPDVDGRVHLMKGMFRTLEVRPAASPARVTPPRADVTIRLVEYAFALSTPITAGRRTIAVENAGTQAHEVLVVRLAPGRTAREAAEWAERGQVGEAPGTMVGGIAAIDPGGRATFTGDFPPGDYALLCFVPDQRDGRGHAHVAYGMQSQLSVPPAPRPARPRRGGRRRRGRRGAPGRGASRSGGAASRSRGPASW